MDALPPRLVAAFEATDWPLVRRELSGVMDGAITDGPYGRELLQLVLSLPAGVDAVFDRYRVAAMLDHGDWDGLRNALPSQSIEPLEIRGKRDILTASVDRNTLPTFDAPHQRLLFEVSEYLARNASGAFRHWAQRIAGHYPQALWDREDVAIGRHLRYRQLQDVALLAVTESQAGRLSVAHALASEATRVGDRQEPIHAVASDLVELVRRGMGDDNQFDLEVPTRICQSTGPSPLGTGELLLYEMPLLPLRSDESLSWSARLLSYIASRLASPRWQLLADTWLVAAGLRDGTPARRTELAALLARSRRATPGLRALPVFLEGYAQRRVSLFEEAESLARRAGNVWLQISALSWIIALDVRERKARRLRLLLDVTGWRRPVLVPSEIAADAALGMTSLGERSESILEMALTADRPNVTTELVRRYIDDPATPAKVRLAAVDALARVGTTHAREILSRLTQRRDDVGKAATSAAQRPGVGLSEREIEVLSLAAAGLTNKQIGEKLFLSPHTVARHLANARGKLGASNRAEAAVLLHRKQTA
ncbi:MAG TPA: LuxR C-terminal-related transcriptional regulator [Candidatus Limnocylindria bacterium]|nr:LuxR C-terminal-related transcriptional regulator [Candidatus Limnocylindria bacterium]